MTRGPVKKLKKFVRERFRYARQFRESRSRSRCSKYAGLLDEVKVFCLFIGYPRSGHSLVGALLDAHENVAMAHELNAIRHQRYGFDRHQILYLILENAAELASTGRATSGFVLLRAWPVAGTLPESRSDRRQKGWRDDPYTVARQRRGAEVSRDDGRRR